MRIVCTYLMLSAVGFAAAICPRELAQLDSSIASVVNQVRWRMFWLGSSSSSEVGEKAQFSLLFNDRYAGYCSKTWRVCTLYEMRKKESQILKVDVMPFDEAIASGTWKLKTNRPLLSEKEGSQNTASHEMVAGGKGIRDPLVKNAEVMGGTNVETIGLRSCVIDGVAVALEVPDSVRLRRRPSLTATLVRAIRQQGLVRRGTSVVVPYFDNHDPGVFIALENSAGGCEVLTAHNLGGGSWAFHPASEIKTGSGISEACRKIESAGMVKLHESRTDQWIE